MAQLSRSNTEAIGSPLSACAFAALAALLPIVPFLPDVATEYLGAANTDMRQQFRYFIEFGVHWMRQGILPQWNPHIFCGTPFLLNTSTTLLYPLNAPLLMQLPQPLSINLCILMHVVVLAVSMVLYGRFRGMTNLAAGFAGATAGLCTIIPVRVFAGHFTIVCTVAWIPLLLLYQERVFRNPARNFWKLGVTGGLMFLGGHLQYVYYAAVLLPVILLITGLSQTEERGRWLLSRVVWHVAAGAIASGIAAVEILPVLDVMRYSARGQVDDIRWLSVFAMTPESFLSFLVPGLFGAKLNYFGAWYWWEVCSYIGVAGVALIAVSCWSSHLRGHARVSLIMFLLSCLLAVGGSLPGVRNVLWYLPGWASFRGHAKIMAYAMIFGTVVAGHALDRLLRPENQQLRKPLIATLGIMAGVVLVGIILSITGTWIEILRSPYMSRIRGLKYDLSSTVLARSAEQAAVTGLTCALGFIVVQVAGWLAYCKWPTRRVAAFLVIASVVDVAWVARSGYQSSFSPEVAVMPRDSAEYLGKLQTSSRGLLAGVDSMNESMGSGAEFVGGHDINVTKYFDTFISALKKVPKGAPHLELFVTGESPLLDAANLEYVAIRNEDREIAGQLPVTKVAELTSSTIYRRASALPRAYVVSAAEWVAEDENQILARLQSPMDFHRSILLCGQPSDLHTSAATNMTPAVVAYSGLHDVTVKAPADGILLLADGFSPRWEAWRNDKRVEVLRANGTFRAVGPVSAGDVIHFSYSRTPLFAGMAVSLFTWIMLVAWNVIARLRTRVSGEAVQQTVA